MIKIRGKLEEYFNKTVPEDESDFATCKYKNNDYEIWEVSESVFDRLNSYTKKRVVYVFSQFLVEYKGKSNGRY